MGCASVVVVVEVDMAKCLSLPLSVYGEVLKRLRGEWLSTRRFVGEGGAAGSVGERRCFCGGMSQIRGLVGRHFILLATADSEL